MPSGVSQLRWLKSRVAYSALVVACVAALGSSAAFLMQHVFNRTPTSHPAEAAPVDLRPDARLPAETAGWDNIVEALLAVFDHVDVVGLGESHTRQADSDLRLRLVRHPDFPRKVHAIVVEMGNSLYQPVLDRYIRGDDVPMTEVQQVWRNIISTGGADSPVYQEFYVAVRDVNLRLPPDQRIRVIAGDPPIDWNKVGTRRDIEPYLQHRGFPLTTDSGAAVRGEKALVIYGSAHLQRPYFPLWAASNQAAANPVPGTFKALNAISPARVLTIVPIAGVDPIERTIHSTDRPLLISLIGTQAGKTRVSPVPTATSTLGDRFDAAIYFGSSDDALTMVPPRPEIYRATPWGAEIARRRKAFSTP